MSDKLLIKEFHAILREVANYLIVVNPDIVKYYSFENFEYDEYPKNKKNFKYHRLVLNQLKHNMDAVGRDDIKHCYQGLELIEQIGGEDGDGGQDYYYIFKFKDKLLKLPGWYSSDGGNGLYWNDISEVVPYEKIVIDYRRVDEKD